MASLVSFSRGRLASVRPPPELDYTLMSITSVVSPVAREWAGGRGLGPVRLLMGAALVQSLSSASSFINL